MTSQIPVVLFLATEQLCCNIGVVGSTSRCALVCSIVRGIQVMRARACRVCCLTRATHQLCSQSHALVSSVVHTWPSHAQCSASSQHSALCRYMGKPTLGKTLSRPEILCRGRKLQALPNPVVTQNTVLGHKAPWP